jgi:hypothetical protein
MANGSDPSVQRVVVLLAGTFRRCAELTFHVSIPAISPYSIDRTRILPLLLAAASLRVSPAYRAEPRVGEQPASEVPYTDVYHQGKQYETDIPTTDHHSINHHPQTVEVEFTIRTVWKLGPRARGTESGSLRPQPMFCVRLFHHHRRTYRIKSHYTYHTTQYPHRFPISPDISPSSPELAPPYYPHRQQQSNMSTKKDMRRPDLGRTLSFEPHRKADEGLSCHLF